MFFEDKDVFFLLISDEKVCYFVVINYGFWDCLNGDIFFLSGYEDKVLGVEFYFYDMEKEEFVMVDFGDK